MVKKSPKSSKKSSKISKKSLKKSLKNTLKNTLKYAHNGTSMCAPNITQTLSNQTCYTDEKLIKMRKYWNNRHPDMKIHVDNPIQIWSELKKFIGGVCNTEQCWLKQQFIKDTNDVELLNYTFATDSPISWKTNPTEWLSSIDIENVMKQYEHAYSSFQFIGPSPIDFDNKIHGECVWNELCNFDINKYIKKGHYKIGFVFNTDPHYLNGSHWISLFLNTKKKYIYYFDSMGNPVPKQIDILINKISNQCKEIGIQLTRFDNIIQHQKLNTECGMYCLYFIIQSIIDKPNNITNRITDEEMISFRKVFFNPSDKEDTFIDE